MNVKIKQNKNTPAVRVASAALAVFVFMFSFCVPAFADSPSDYENGLDFGVVPYIPGSGNYNTDYVGTADGRNISFVTRFDTSEAPIYVFCTYGGSNMYWYAASESQYAGNFVLLNLFNSNGDYYSQIDRSLYSYNTDYNLYVTDYFLKVTSAENPTTSVAQFYTKADGIAALREYIDNPPNPIPDPQGPLNISIPCGNALFVDVTGLTGLTGSLTTQTNQSHSTPFSWNPTLSYTDTVPTSGTTIGSPINWVGTGGTDVFGRYRTWKCTLIVQPNKKYIAITNPFFNSDYLDPEHEDTNFPITVSLSNYRDYFFVPLNAEYVNGEGVQNYYTDEQTQAPIPGGNNSTTTGNSINDFLQNIASSISGFFQGAIGAVSTLVSSGSDFIRSLSGLYAWLPAPVYAVLTSALILVITIGVIKVFI